jgi:hypothetical protein
VSPSEALVGGTLGTLAMSIAIRAATELGWTRMDLPFLLGTALTPHRIRAKAIGYAMHFVIGVAFGFLYQFAFSAIGRAGWPLGAAIGLLHGLFVGTVLVNIALPIVHPRMGTPSSAADSTPLLEPPGFMLLNYGRMTPLVTLLAHVLFGAIVGAVASQGPPHISPPPML